MTTQIKTSPTKLTFFERRKQSNAMFSAQLNLTKLKSDHIMPNDN